MSDTQPNAKQILAVLLGASKFPRSPKLAQGRSFYNSADEFEKYLTSSDGLGVPPDNVLSLFDDSSSPSDQLQEVRAFLERRSTELKNEGTPAQDLIVYYVGHGLFSNDNDKAYCIAVRTTAAEMEGVTSIHSSQLASIIKASARHVRKFLIFDCCFSAAAYKEFQSGPLQAEVVKLLQEFPNTGTALLCSASANETSRAPETLSRTMFSDALLRVLDEGHTMAGSRLSLSEIGGLIRTDLRERYRSDWVRPEVHSPDQREGDVARVPLFPNKACGARKSTASRGDSGTQRQQRGAEVRQRIETRRRGKGKGEECRRQGEAENMRLKAESDHPPTKTVSETKRRSLPEPSVVAEKETVEAKIERLRREDQYGKAIADLKVDPPELEIGDDVGAAVAALTAMIESSDTLVQELAKARYARGWINWKTHQLLSSFSNCKFLFLAIDDFNVVVAMRYAPRDIVQRAENAVQQAQTALDLAGKFRKAQSAEM